MIKNTTHFQPFTHLLCHHYREPGKSCNPVPSEHLSSTLSVAYSIWMKNIHVSKISTEVFNSFLDLPFVQIFPIFPPRSAMVNFDFFFLANMPRCDHLTLSFYFHFFSPSLCSMLFQAFCQFARLFLGQFLIFRPAFCPNLSYFSRHFPGKFWFSNSLLVLLSHSLRRFAAIFIQG